MHLVDIQKEPISTTMGRGTSLFIEGYCPEVSSLIEFDVANVAHPVLSSGRLTSKGHTLAFGEHESYMETDCIKVKELVFGVARSQATEGQPPHDERGPNRRGVIGCGGPNK